MVARSMTHEELNRAIREACSLDAPDRLSALCEREALSFTGAVVDSLREAITILDSDYVVVYANRSFYTLFGTTLDKTVGQSLFAIDGGRWDTRCLRTLLERVLLQNNAFENLEMTVDTSQGRRVLLLSGRQLLRQNDTGPMILLAMEDVTGRKAMQNELKRAHEELEARVRDVVEMQRTVAVRDEVERMSRHDLKTPLAAMVGFARLLGRADNLTVHQREMLSWVEEAGYRMQEMINLSLNLYRMETGSFVPEPEPVDLTRIICDVVKELTPLAQSMGVEVEASVNGNPLPDADWVPVEGNEALFFSMLENIVKNAIEASSAGDQVRMELTDKGDRALIAVSNPAAIPEQARPRFFDKYNTYGKKDGSGLGAYNARLICTNFGGGMGFSTSESEGTRIWIDLPRVFPRPSVES